MEDVPQAWQRDVAINAVNCASKLKPGYPIYFASDSAYASESVRQYAVLNNYTIFTNDVVATKSTSRIHNHNDPLHLDFAARGNKTWPVEAYYDIFVDLLVLGNARCVSLGMGGYGAYANYLSFDPKCANRHMGKTIRKVYRCHSWYDPTNITTIAKTAKATNQTTRRRRRRRKKKES
jgi:hypothetical protein